MMPYRSTNRWIRLPAVGLLALALAPALSIPLLPASAVAADNEEESAKKADWQDRYRTIRNNALRMRDNATKIRRAYDLSQHSNNSQAGIRERFKQQVLETERKAEGSEAQLARFLADARESQIPPAWIYEVDDEPMAPSVPAAAAGVDPSHPVNAPGARNPAYSGGATDDDEAADQPADPRGASYGDFSDDRDDQYRVRDLEDTDKTTAEESKSEF
jgi:hypothetical protein